MALDGYIEKTTKTPDDTSLSSVNLNSVSDRTPAKPVQVADDGVFNRNRGQGQPVQGGRAHPFSNTGDAYTAVTGKPAPEQTAPTPSWQQHVQEQTPKLEALGDKQQAIVSSAATGGIKGNAIDVGFADNKKRMAELNKDWDLIGDQGGIIGAMGTAGRIAGVGAGAWLTGTVAHGIRQRHMAAEQSSLMPVHDKQRAEVVALKDKVTAEYNAVKDTPAKAQEAALLEEKSNLLNKMLHGPTQTKLDTLSTFTKDRPGAFTAAERETMKGLAENEAKLGGLAKGLTAGADVKGFTGWYENGKAGLRGGLKFVAGSFALNEAFKYGAHILPGDHSQSDHIFTQSTQESFVQGIIGASPIKNFGTKLAVGAAAWLAGREEKMTTGQSLVTTVGLGAATIGASFLVPSLRKELPKVLAAEAGAFVVGRGVHMVPGLGSTSPEISNASTSAWDAMKTDSDKTTGATFNKAVNKFDDLGDVSRGILAAYQRDIMGGINVATLPLAHDKAQGYSYKDIVTNGRTGMALSEALGDTVLKAGLTEDTRSDLMGTYFKKTSDEKPASDQTIIAPNQGDLDLTSRAARSYMSAIAAADVTIKNMQAGQKATDDTSGNNYSNADIQAVADEKAKIIKTMQDKIFRSSPGAEAHDIKDIVEGTGSNSMFGYFGNANANSFKLTDWAKHDQNAYSHTVTALEDKAYKARDSWLPGQASGQNADISKQYVAKIFRDAAVMRLGYMNYLLTSQTEHSSAPTAQDTTEMAIYMEGSNIGRQLDGPNANRNVKSTVEAAYALDPNNPDMKAIVDEYNNIANRVKAFQQNYKDTHGGQDPQQNPIANPFGVPKPANAN